MDKQIKNLEKLRRRIKMAVDDCNLMTEAEYKRAREYISNRYKVSLPYERPEPKIKP